MVTSPVNKSGLKEGQQIVIALALMDVRQAVQRAWENLQYRISISIAEWGTTTPIVTIWSAYSLASRRVHVGNFLKVVLPLA